MSCDLELRHLHNPARLSEVNMSMHEKPIALLQHTTRPSAIPQKAQARAGFNVLDAFAKELAQASNTMIGWEKDKIQGVRGAGEVETRKTTDVPMPR